MLARSWSDHLRGRSGVQLTAWMRRSRSWSDHLRGRSGVQLAARMRRCHLTAWMRRSVLARSLSDHLRGSGVQLAACTRRCHASDGLDEEECACLELE